MLRTLEQQIGLLQVTKYLMGIIAAVAAMGWSWELYPFLALNVVTLPYAVWREIRNLEMNALECGKA
jgi:hypothetical protein